MRLSKGADKSGAVLALAVCVIKGLMAAAIFASLPNTPVQHHSPYVSVAMASRLAEAEQAQALTHRTEEAVAAPQKAPTSGATPLLTADNSFLPSDDVSTEISHACLSSEDSDEKTCATGHYTFTWHAPPLARHEAPPEYTHSPRPSAGLFLAWSTPPPLPV